MFSDHSMHTIADNSTCVYKTRVTRRFRVFFTRAIRTVK